MSGLLVFAGIIWIIVQLVKDASIKPAPKGHNHTKALSDYHRNHLSQKEFNRRIDAGYYVDK